MDAVRLASEVARLRAELTGYLTRLVARPALAEELVQATYLKAHEALDRCPQEDVAARRWLFRIATNLALDELRRHGNWREEVVFDLRESAESDPEFVKRSTELVASPEHSLIAKEHLAACFSCTMRSFAPVKASALLLKEVYGFSIEEISELTGGTVNQVKNWLQEARASIEARYGRTCALVTKNGVCHQCVELAGFFGVEASFKPPVTLAGRFEALRELRAKAAGEWHRMLFALIDDDGNLVRRRRGR